MAKGKNPEEEDVGFFAIIPATVRYDKSLPPGAKLLYGEISALAKKKGYCWSRNPYFAELYDTSERTIIEWIWRLHAAGHIDIYFKYFPGSKKIARRYISLPYPHNKEFPKELSEAHFVERKKPIEPGLMVKKPSPPEGLVVKEISPLMVKEPSPPEGLVVKETSPHSSEENSLVIYTNSNKTSSSFSDLPESGKPPPEEDPVLHPKNQNDSAKIIALKEAIKQIDGKLIFSGDFYPKAIAFMSSNSLPPDYAAFVYKFCLQKKPKSLDGYFYKVFFDPRCAELFLEDYKQPSVSVFLCPVCSSAHDPSLSSCPVCGLSAFDRNDLDEIGRKKLYYNMPPDIKMSYDEEAASLLESVKRLPFQERSGPLRSLDRKYGLIDL